VRFGASYCYEATSTDRFWQAMEVRAFGLFLQDMVQRLDNSSCSSSLQLKLLVERCLSSNAMDRPLFADVQAELWQMLVGQQLPGDH